MNEQRANKFNTLAVLLIILFIASFISSLFPNGFLWLFAPGMVEQDTIMAFTVQTNSLALIFSAFSLSVHIGCAIWLFVETKKDSTHAFVWAALGLFSGVVAVILWYLKGIYEELSND